MQGALDARIVQKIVRRQTAAIRACYERAPHGLSAKMLKGLEFMIGPNGRVVRVKIAGAVSPQLSACLERAIKRMRFPKPKGGGSVHIRYPMLMSSSGGAPASVPPRADALRPRGPVDPQRDNRSTFAVDVDTASYSISRSALLSGTLPAPSLVRVEEFLNYFRYDYSPPQNVERPFSIQLDGARSPVARNKHLLRIGLHAQDSAPRPPANLVFLVDTSCSMTAHLPRVKESLAIAIEHLSPKDQVAITTYAGDVRAVLQPTSLGQKARILEALRDLAPGGGTAMDSGLQLAYRQAHAMIAPRTTTRIIVCSDGDANIGRTDHQSILKTLKGYISEGVFLSTIGFGDGNYQDAMMEQLADRGNGNYFYIDSMRQAQRVFGRDLDRMLHTVAQDVKVQVRFNPEVVEQYRLLGYENRALKDDDFRDDRVDAGEIGAGHQVTALYELQLKKNAKGQLASVSLRAKRPRGERASEHTMSVDHQLIDRPLHHASEDLRFAVAVWGAAALLRGSRYALGWSYARVLNLIDDLPPERLDEDRKEFRRLMTQAHKLSRSQ